MIKDMFGNELKPGDVIAYTTRHSSSMTTHIAKVTWVGEQAVKVLTHAPSHHWNRTYNTTLTSSKTVIKVDQDCLPQHIKFELELVIVADELKAIDQEMAGHD